jgi:predicted O-linked N-acetylglucosamine transferase (SPINDLY family)
MNIAKTINDAKSHVAVNLDGWTSMGRTNDVFALTPAPVQVLLVVKNSVLTVLFVRAKLAF